jgi:hypothetical protein
MISALPPASTTRETSKRAVSSFNPAAGSVEGKVTGRFRRRERIAPFV